MISSFPSRSSIILVLLLLLVGCATSKHSLSARSEQLQRAQTWSMTGKLGLQSPAENTSLGIWWTQDNDDEFEITFRGALSFGAGRLSSHEESGVKLERNGEEVVYGSSPEQLVGRLVGEEIPVSPMKYWVRGIPSPQASYSIKEGSDEGSAESSIEQMGWTIEYKMDSRGLPKRIILNRDDVRLKLVVKSWTY